MSWCILPNKTCIGENVGLHSVIIPKRFLKIRLSIPTHTHTFPTQNCPNIWQKFLTMLLVTIFFSLLIPFSYQEIFLMQTIRNEIASYSWVKANSSRHTCNSVRHIATITACHRIQEQKKKEYQFQWQLPLHTTLLILTGTHTYPNTTSMLWEELITYDMLNPQSQIVMDTNNGLVRSNSLPILKPTFTHSLMVSQKDITYCCNNIHHQGQLTFHYTHHMLTAQLPSLTHYIYVHAHFNFMV
jgi:hypothetical protein